MTLKVTNLKTIKKWHIKVTIKKYENKNILKTEMKKIWQMKNNQNMFEKKFFG